MWANITSSLKSTQGMAKMLSGVSKSESCIWKKACNCIIFKSENILINMWLLAMCFTVRVTLTGTKNNRISQIYHLTPPLQPPPNWLGHKVAVLCTRRWHQWWLRIQCILPYHCPIDSCLKKLIKNFFQQYFFWNPLQNMLSIAGLTCWTHFPLKRNSQCSPREP